MPAAEARRLEVRVVRRLPALAARLRGRAAARWPSEIEIAYFLEARRATVARALRPLARRGLDHHRRRRRAHPDGPRAVAPAGDDRRVRDRRRHPGAAQLRRRRRLPVGRVRHARSTSRRSRPRRRSRDHVHVDFELQGCPLNKRQLLEVISAFLNERRPAIAVAQRVRRVQAPRQRVRDGRPRHAVPRAGHPRRLRRALPRLRPRLLRLLRADGDAERRLAGRLARAARRRRASTSCACSAPSTRTRRTFRERARPMSAEPTSTRTIKTDCLARVEGEGAMHVRIRDGASTTCSLRIYEPPRFFEALLRGRALHRGARHHRAHLRHLPGRLPDERLRGDGGRLRRDGRPSRSATLRRLLYCGEWIESHALHVFMLHAPDFLGYESAIAMAARPPRDRRSAALRIKKAGNELMRAGRRARDPPDQRARRRLLPRRPAGASCGALAERLEAARELALDDGALGRHARLPRARGGLRVRRAVASPATTRSSAAGSSRARGLDIAPGEYEEHFVEEHVPHSTALHSRPARARLVPGAARWPATR